jgi:hypothetical protein
MSKMNCSCAMPYPLLSPPPQSASAQNRNNNSTMLWLNAVSVAPLRSATRQLLTVAPVLLRQTAMCLCLRIPPFFGTERRCHGGGDERNEMCRRDW